ncbi:MAG: carcinine hydrolase/isopenicillin-N N-acyltransferase family protein [Candidatus Aminicenantales bacterium]
MGTFKKSFFILLIFLLFSPSIFSQEECTTAVISGSATVDGRPLLWKNRDVDNPDNEVVYITGGKYEVVGVITANNTLSMWMGINSAGFAIENSVSYDLEGTSSADNGTFMKQALLNCATVDEFEQLLIDTNNPGRATKANYGVIDATGNAAVFEAGNHTYTRFDANNPAQAPLGFIVRTNFALTGDGTGSGYERYDRANALLNEKAITSEISFDYILRKLSRDLKNDAVNPYPLPYEGTQDGHPAGYIRTNYSINRYRTRSCAVFQGVLPGEDPRLSTMWVILGEPVCGVAVPVWVFAGTTPPEMNGLPTSPMCDLSQQKKQLCYTDTSADPLSYQYINTYALDDGAGGGIFSYSFPIEDWAITQATTALNSWRTSFPTARDMKDFEYRLIAQTYCSFLTSSPPNDTAPPLNFSVRTVLNRSLSQAEYINVLTWEPNPENSGITAYRIYLVEGESRTRLAEVNPGNIEYWHRDVDPSRQYFYSIAAVDAQNLEGSPACSAVSRVTERENREDIYTGQSIRKRGKKVNHSPQPGAVSKKDR